jgi:SMI1 / KNR4 family (SUKH-1)
MMTKMSDIAEKLDAFGLRPIRPFGPSVITLPKPWDDSPYSYPEILEQRGFHLPADYRTYLLAHPQTVTLQKEVVFSPRDRSPWIAKSGSETLEVLFGKGPDSSSDLLAMCDSDQSLMPDFLPIGEVGFANLVYLCLRKESLGEIYVWDHEHDDEVDGLYYVTSSFTAFVDMLQEVDPAIIAARPKSTFVPTEEIPEEMKRLVEEYKNREKNQ